MVLGIIDIQKNNDYLRQCGGKGSNLFRLHQLGVSVPPFVIIPQNSILASFGGKIQPLNLLLNEWISDVELSSIEQAYAIKKIIENIKFSDSFRQELLTGIGKNLRTDKLFSVRSSVNQEDGLTNSFAGLFKTSLNVSIENIFDAILESVLSLYDANVLEYCRIKKVDLRDLKIAIIIQEMVSADSSGIAFSMNPNGNFNDILISCAKGYGEGVVNNSSEITNYFICRQSRSVSKNEMEKEILSLKQIDELVNIIIKIEKFFKSPQDIEFSFDCNGNLFLLQSRPITTIDLINLKIVDNTNIVESYPGLTLPLSFTFARNGYKRVFAGAARLFKISEKKIDEIDNELSNMITLVHGRVYYNLHNWYKLMQLVLADENSMQAWETLIGVKIKSGTPTTLKFLQKIRSSLISLQLLFRYRKIVQKFYTDFDSEYAKLRDYADNLKINNPTSNEVFAFYLQISDRIFSNWAPTLLNDFFTFKFFDLLKKFTENLGIKTEDTIVNDLLCGIPGVESEMLVIELLKIKEEIHSTAILKEIFCKPSTEIIEILPETFKQKLDTFITRYGDRTLEELKLETPNFRMKPELLIDLIKSQLMNVNTDKSVLKQQILIKENAEKRVEAKINLFSIKRLIYKFIITRTREAVKNRENMRLRRTRSYGVVKELFLYIGLEMRKSGIIENATDVFYLDISRLEDYSKNGASAAFFELIDKIKAEYQLFESESLPDRMVFNGNTPPINKSSRIDKSNDKIFHGMIISKGKLKAETIVLHKPDYNQSVDGKVLVTQMTDPAWVFLMTRAAGLICEKGSPLSHTAIVGRELGIPVLIGIQNATINLPTGTKIHLNCDEGFVEKLEI